MRYDWKGKAIIMSTIKTHDVDFVASGGDAGLTFEVMCPECGETIQVSEHGWGDQKCSCGYKWSIDIIASGWKEDLI